ncbi:MAG: YceI family protein [Boseongicola sp. SB0662_bin_57]|nr:YceI family protein [Boseongicola sp. SB0662_bin_57]
MTSTSHLRHFASMLSRRLILMGLCTLPLPAHAMLRRYELEPNASRAGFTYWMNGARRKGEMPVGRADFQIDPSNLAASSADVTLRADQVRAGFFLVTGILKSAAMLDTDRFPTIRFVSTAVRPAKSGRLSDGAKLAGELTIRDVTQAVTFDTLFVPRAGSAQDDLGGLTVRLTGQISRSSFGASGYKALVGDEVGLNVVMAMRAIN